MCQKVGKGFASKSDMSSTFRHLPLRILDFMIMIMKATNPNDGKTYYFVDKCLPFGNSISCAVFQAFSDAVSHIVEFKTGKVNVNYLDDYLFISITKILCNQQVDMFIWVCNQINFPVALEKTEWATQMIVSLGPVEKIERACVLIDEILKAKKSKVTLLQIQRIAGYLNFLCRSVVPGQAFTARHYALTVGKLKPYHHLRVPSDIKLDLRMWLEFLNKPNIYCRPFSDFAELTAEDILMFSDASKSEKLKFGAYCQNDWMAYMWSESTTSKSNNFIKDMDPSIEFLELFGVTAAVLQWIYRFANKKIFLFCDNESVVHMINKSSSKCRNCMTLIRLITLEGMLHNVRIYAKHLRSEANDLADALSRNQMQRFWSNAPPTMSKLPTKISDKIWPVQNIWLK